MTTAPDPRLTLVVPYYDQPRMLALQAETWEAYPLELAVIVVDDGSPEHPAEGVVPPTSRATIYRICRNLPWNRNEARNLGTRVAETGWLIHVDVDHVLPAVDALVLVEKLRLRLVDPRAWYRLRRFRVGRADETRRKDTLPDTAVFGEVKPHVDSFVIHRSLYHRAGGYDLDYSGSIGGSAPFLGQLKRLAGDAIVLHDVRLHVHTRDSIPDASDSKLSRDRSRFERLRREKRAAGDRPPRIAVEVRNPWRRVR